MTRRRYERSSNDRQHWAAQPQHWAAQSQHWAALKLCRGSAQAAAQPVAPAEVSLSCHSSYAEFLFACLLFLRTGDECNKC
jgi:hypothetical protein